MLDAEAKHACGPSKNRQKAVLPCASKCIKHVGPVSPVIIMHLGKTGGLPSKRIRSHSGSAGVVD